MKKKMGGDRQERKGLQHRNLRIGGLGAEKRTRSDIKE